MIKVDFNFKDKELNGLAWLTIKPHFYTTNKLVLDAKAMLIHQVLLENKKKISEIRNNLNLWSQNETSNEEFYKNVILFKGGAKAMEIYKSLHPEGKFRD